MSDYSAPLQTAIPAIERFIRGEILEEFISQVKAEKYSSRNIGFIIRNTESLLSTKKAVYKNEELSDEKKQLAWSNEKWLLDRKSELQEIVITFKKYLTQERILTDEMVSEMILKITKAGALFELISIKGIHSIENIRKAINDKEKFPTKVSQNHFVDTQRKLIDAWALKFIHSLKDYVQVSDDLILYETLYYMIIPKAGTAKNTRYSYIRKRIAIHIKNMRMESGNGN